MIKLPRETIYENYNTKTIKKKDDDEKKSKDDKKKSKTVYSYSKDKSWDMETETIEQCPYMENDQKVIIETNAKHKIEAMMDVMGSDEWIGLLKGVKDEDKMIVKDLHIPKQKVSSARAKKTDKVEPKETIGVIHSHHDMGSFFSGTDEENVNQNYNLSLVIDSDFEFEGMARIRTECNKIGRVGVDIEVEDEYDIEKEWAKKVKEENIETSSYRRRKKYPISTYYENYYRNSKKNDDDEDDKEDDDKESTKYCDKWKKFKEEYDEDIDYDKLYDEYEKYLKKSGYYDEKDDDDEEIIFEDEDWDWEDEDFESEDETNDYIGKTINLNDIDDDEIEEIAVAAVDIPKIKAGELCLIDWLTIYRPDEYNNYHNMSDEEKAEIVKDYIEFTKAEEVEYVNNDDIPQISMNGKRFDKWLRDVKPDIYYIWNEVDNDVQDELIDKFRSYMEKYKKSENN